VLFLSALTKSFVFLIVVLFLSPVLSAGTWWDSNWEYRKAITVTNLSGTELTDYQVKVTLSYDSGMQQDFDDIRFTSSGGTTLISHWRESYTASSSVVFWVKVPSIPTGGTTIYMYYGNPSVTSQSVFSSIAEDFWQNQTSYNAPPPIQTPYDFTVESHRSWGGGQWSAAYNGIRFNYANTQDKFTVNFTTKFTQFSHPSSYLDRSVYFFDAYTEDNNGIFTMFRRGNTMYVYDGPSYWAYWNIRSGTYSKNIGSMYTNTGYNIRIDFDGVTWRVYVNGALKRTITQATYKNSPVGWVRISGRHVTNSYGSTDTVNQIRILSDSFYQNQYVFPEPALGIGGVEQSGAPCVTGVSFNFPLFELEDSVTATATATDPNGDPITEFDFRVLDGLGNEVLNPSVQGSGFYSFTAVGEPGLWQIKVKASDGTYWSSEFTEVVFVNDPGLATVGLGLSDGIYSSTELVDGSVVLSGTQSSGSFITPAIDPVNFSKWGVVTFSKTTPGNSTLTVDVLKASDDSILISDIQNGQNISESIGDIPIKLGANFTSGSTPSLDSWDVSYYSQFKITVTDCSAPYSGDVTAEAVRVSDSEEFGPFTGTGGQVFVEVPPGIYNIQACIPANEKCSWKYNVELA